MGLLRARPFLVLAVFTLAVGALWHVSGLRSEDGPVGRALFIISYVLGMPFILAMRFVGSIVSHPGARGLLGFALGLLPYLAADAVWRRRVRMKRDALARAKEL